MIVYKCIFEIPEVDSCKVKNLYKMKPELLVKYCKLCPELLEYRAKIITKYLEKVI